MRAITLFNGPRRAGLGQIVRCIRNTEAYS
jgi:hypothetical protein